MDSLKISVKNKIFSRWESISFCKRNEVSLSSKKAFNQQRIAELNKNNIFINENEVSYKTRWWRIITGKVIWLWEDVTEKQIIFQSNEGKNFLYLHKSW